MKYIVTRYIIFACVLGLTMLSSCSENIIHPPIDPGGNGSHAWSQFGFDARLSGNPYGPRVEIPPFYGSNIVWEVNLGRGDIHGNHCIDSKGNIYIRFSSGTVPDTCYILKFNKDGELLWKNKYENMLHNTEGGNSLSADEKTLYVASYTGLFSIDSSGTLNWVVYDNQVMYSQASKPAIDKSGNIYVVLGSYELYSISPAGKVNWKYNNNTFGNPSIDSKGKIYVPYVNSSTEQGVLKLSNSGSLEYKLNIVGTPFSISIDKDDNIYFTFNTCHGGCGALASYDNTGNLRWMKEMKLYLPGHYFSIISPLLTKVGTILTIGGQGDGQTVFFRGIMAFDSKGDSVFSFPFSDPTEWSYRLTKDSYDNIYYYYSKITGSQNRILGAIDINGKQIFENQTGFAFSALSPEGGYITFDYIGQTQEYILQFRK